MSQPPPSGSEAGSAAANTTGGSNVLELSLNQDGSLQTAPLSTVLLTATHDLYQDLYNMTQGDLDVVVAAEPSQHGSMAAAAEDAETADASALGAPAAVATTRRDTMANLSFAQRRHELAWRLAQHNKSFQHVAALTASAAIDPDIRQQRPHVVRVASAALQHARTAWIQADEAQDALYFFHAQLFPARAAPHDVYGALDVLIPTASQPPKDTSTTHTTLAEQPLSGCSWFDLPTDLRLDASMSGRIVESLLSKEQVAQEWHMAVRRKLLRGEVGWMARARRKPEPPAPVLWKVSLLSESGSGGVVKLVAGEPKLTTASSTDPANANQQQKQYPIEALLTVFSSSLAETAASQEDTAVTTAPWTLLALNVTVQPKTGEFHHHLVPTHRQRYDLHRLAALAMSRQEQETLKQQKEQTENQDVDDQTDTSTPLQPPARPLQALFQVAHEFMLSWALQILSAQAQALRRGVWGVVAGGAGTGAAGAGTTSGQSAPLHVTPVDLYPEHNHASESSTLLGVVSISFWKVDDAYGPPSMSDLRTAADDTESGGATISAAHKDQKRHASDVSNMLTLSIRAESDVGIRVSLSGAQGIMDVMRQQQSSSQRIRSTVAELLQAASNPFALSASDALLAATQLCAERKAVAVVNALQGTSILPEWMFLTVEDGAISVASHVQYRGVQDSGSRSRGMPVLFRLVCDARTGSIVCTFPQSAQLLRRLACNDLQASESMALRTASLPQNRRRTLGTQSSGRVVRDAFDGLVRSMNVLGQRTGVGGTCWDDLDSQSASLRERSVQSACADVRISLIKCCGMASLYGLTPLALGVALGLDGLADVAGGTVQPLDGVSFLAAPPVSIMFDQQLVETSTSTPDGDKKKESHLEQSLFSVVCCMDNPPMLVPLDVSVKLHSPASPIDRTACEMLQFETPQRDGPSVENGHHEELNKKRQKLEMNGEKPSTETVDIMAEAERFAEILSTTIDSLTS